ncbi:hypothetical protein, partial [Prauserella alba]
TLGAVTLTSAPAAAAPASETVAQPAPNAMTLGVLGPVGLAAIVLGVIGMVAGVIRQRRKKARELSAGSGPAGTTQVAPGSAAAEVATVTSDDVAPAPVRPPGPRAAADSARAGVTVD